MPASRDRSPERAAVDVVLLVMNQGAQPETLTTSPTNACAGTVIVRAWRDVNGRRTLAWASSPFVEYEATDYWSALAQRPAAARVR